jgi:hypothetical protein
MSTHGSNEDDTEGTHISKESRQAEDRSDRGGSGFSGAGYAVDRSSGATLIERVLRFLDKYRQSIDGFE